MPVPYSLPTTKVAAAAFEGLAVAVLAAVPDAEVAEVAVAVAELLEEEEVVSAVKLFGSKWPQFAFSRVLQTF